MSEVDERKNPLVAGVAATAITVGFVVATVLFWTQFAPADSLLSIPVMAYFLGAILLVQLVRCVFMDEWLGRCSALGTVVGVVVILVGLNPIELCADTLPPQCSTSFEPVLPILAVGFLLTAALVYVDIWRR